MHLEGLQWVLAVSASVFRWRDVTASSPPAAAAALTVALSLALPAASVRLAIAVAATSTAAAAAVTAAAAAAAAAALALALASVWTRKARVRPGRHLPREPAVGGPGRAARGALLLRHRNWRVEAAKRQLPVDRVRRAWDGPLPPQQEPGRGGGHLRRCTSTALLRR